MSCAVHWRARRASFPSKSFCSFLIKQEKQRGKRSVARAADWLNSFFLQYKITNCPDYRTISQDKCTLFARYLHSTLYSWIIIKSTCIWNSLKSSYLKNDSRAPSDCCTFNYNRLHRSPPLLPSRYQFFHPWHSVFISLHPSAYSLANLSLLHILPTSNWLPIDPFPISHPSIHPFNHWSTSSALSPAIFLPFINHSLPFILSSFHSFFLSFFLPFILSSFHSFSLSFFLPFIIS